ncbi:cyclic pyranopterin monophosphate synthase MoaC [Candidatus Geothermarchaeota archaeon]|nr:MAG: cyclic pyranopterin monophosphate synthase MoaC [Candidatus Geothermarchaeota archaeon]
MKRIKMIDITEKEIVYREAEAEGKIFLKKSTIRRIKNGEIEKGDPLVIAKIAAIQAVKKTPEIIPLCHPIKITNVEINEKILEDNITLVVKVKALERTGVEMEALNGVLAGLLTIWDVVKKYEKDKEGQYPITTITDIKVRKKIKGHV